MAVVQREERAQAIHPRHTRVGCRSPRRHRPMPRPSWCIDDGRWPVSGRQARPRPRPWPTYPAGEHRMHTEALLQRPLAEPQRLLTGFRHSELHYVSCAGRPTAGVADRDAGRARARASESCGLARLGALRREARSLSDPRQLQSKLAGSARARERERKTERERERERERLAWPTPRWSSCVSLR